MDQSSVRGSVPARTAPVEAGERNTTIDVLRGFALLGILIMNIPFFALSHHGFMYPPVLGGFDGADFAAWLGSHLLFDAKMMTIFSMLFGAGMVLMSERAAARGASPARLYYRRIGWLAVFGLLHAYGVWYGDILFTYAVCGVALYPMRRLSPRVLLAIAAALLLVGMGLSSATGVFFGYAREHMPDEWRKILEGFRPTPAMLDAERGAMLGSPAEYLRGNAEQSLMMHLMFLPLYGVWRVLGVMMLGMALYKWGVLTGARSARFYALLAAIGFGVGLPVVGLGAWRMVRSDFDPANLFLVDWHFNGVGSVILALGWIGLVTLLSRAAVLGRIAGALAAVGRTALSNYFFQSIVCTTLFCGWGFGLWGSLSRAQLLGVVVAVWAVQLVISPLWLRRYRFGPAEWVWRSLTYGKAQPMARAA